MKRRKPLKPWKKWSRKKKREYLESIIKAKRMRVGYYIDYDLLLYWLVLKFDITVNLKYFTTPMYWHKASMEWLNIGFYYGKKIRYYCRFEILNLHFSVFRNHFFTPISKRHFINKENIYASSQDWVFFRWFKYMDFFRSLQCNRYRWYTSSNYYPFFRWLHYNFIDQKSYFKNNFLSKFRYMNAETSIMFFLQKYVLNTQQTWLKYRYSKKTSLFCLASTWLFQRTILYWHYTYFSNREPKYFQHKMFLNNKRLYFRIRYIVCLSHTLILNSEYWENVSHHFQATELFMHSVCSGLSYNHMNIILNKEHENPLIWNDLIWTKSRYHRNCNYFDMISNFAVNFYPSLYTITNNYDHFYPIYHKEMFKNLYKTIGGYFGQKLYWEYGNLIELFQYKDLNALFDVYLINSLIIRTQMINYHTYCLLTKEYMTVYYFDDTMYFYKEREDKNATFFEWHWYTFFDGCDEHTSWGWYGRITTRKRKSEKRHLINDVNFRLVFWLFKYIEEIY